MKTVNSSKSNDDILYKIDDKPPMGMSILLGFQHIMAAFGGIVAVPLIVGGALKLPGQDIAFLVSAALFAAGITTYIQARGVGPVGARLPCVMGTDFTFVGPSLVVGAAYGLPGIFGATIMGSFIEIFLSRFIRPLRKFFPPIVTGTVVMLIGLTLLPVAIDWSAGGVGSKDYGSIRNLCIALSVLTVIVLLNRYGKGILSTASVIIGLIFGYAICFPLGMLDFSTITNASWIAFPMPLKYGITFKFSAFVAFITAYLVTTVETVGCLFAVGEAAGKDLSSEDISRGILCDGVGSLIAGFVNAGPNTSFSQNVGLIPLTKVASKSVVAISGIILMVLGIFPKFGAIVAIMPNPVLGGAGIIMFGMVVSAGIKTLKDVELNNRNMLILAVSLGVGIGVSVRPDILSSMPAAVKSFFSSGISAGTVVALLLNIVLKDESKLNIDSKTIEPIKKAM
ncbi:purine permease [Clostridium bowmanii]|uniref:uracil-xanthine permease family protein n=1 Tax=Clostridium bowmanii TaxID=132925 RepID=UPI001C0D71EE|nr:nucleobase:cation symporter-2 family protein [Clostridium bowmanii]MBU3188868.1 purine permease [Clostridium bowmanii]MCA1073726.1 purine permease [Clostridium bowmanii]